MSPHSADAYPLLEAIVTVLRGAGLTDRPDLFDGNIHSWRCSYLNGREPCSCFQDLADDLLACFTSSNRSDA